METKKSIILKYFQKKDKLSTNNSFYCQKLSSLFDWLYLSDQAKEDKTTAIFNLSFPIPAKIIAKKETVIAGMEEFAYLLNKRPDLTLDFSKGVKKDGQIVKSNEIVTEIYGKTGQILRLERTILNLLQRMSGIATYTNRLIKTINNLSPKTYHLSPFIAATRKTPYMQFDKKAVSVGGGLTHRLSLKDGIIIKDNHISAIKYKHKLKNINQAIAKALSLTFKQVKDTLVEIEVETSNQAQFVIDLFEKENPSLIIALMLDNFTCQKAKETVFLLSQRPSFKKIIIEASGNITENNITDWAKTGVDLLSLGSLTHSAKSADLSLEI